MEASCSTTTISLCMIVRDEASNLAHCLDSVAGVVDEIIIVDTGSTDQTKSIAAQFGAKIYDFTWEDDFSTARNFGLDQASGDWVLILDADEYLEQTEPDKLRKLISRDQPADAYLLPLKNIIMPGFDEYQVSLVLRLFRNSAVLRFQGKIHEQVIIPVDFQAESAETGPFIIHLGYQDSKRAQKSHRNRQMLKQALRSEPDNPYYHFYISTEYINCKDFRKALGHIRLALAGIPQTVLLFRTAVIRNAVLCLNHLDQQEEAAAVLEAEIGNFPDFPDYHYYLANIYREKTEYSKAILHYTKALSCNSPSLAGCSILGSGGYKSLFYIGLCHEKLRRYFDAIDCYVLALRNNPSFQLPIANLAKCLLTVGTINECQDFLNKTFRIESDGLQVFLSRMFLAGGYPREALNYLDYPFGEDLETSQERYLLTGEILLALGEVFKAKRYFRKIPENEPLFPSSLVFRCLCDWKKNKPADKQTINLLFQNQHTYHTSMLLLKINSVFSEELTDDRFRPLYCEELKQNMDDPANLSLARDLVIKLLELKTFRLAQMLGNCIVQLEPALTWELAYHFRQAGALEASNDLLKHSRADYSESRFTEEAKMYLRISDTHLQRVPVMP